MTSANPAADGTPVIPERVGGLGGEILHFIGGRLAPSVSGGTFDVADPATVAAFARVIENPERLRLLLVLTVADIRAVGPGVWNGWKGQLMRELYGATETLFRGGRMSDAPGMARRRLEAIAYDKRTALVAADREIDFARRDQSAAAR